MNNFYRKANSFLRFLLGGRFFIFLHGVLLVTTPLNAQGSELEPQIVQSHEDADWTILVYVQARNNLSSFSTRNFNDMAAVGSNKKLNLLVQWYKPEDQGVWRYKIEKNQLKLDTYLAAPTDGNK